MAERKGSPRDLFPTFRELFSLTPAGVIAALKQQKRKNKRARELQTSRLSDLEQRLAAVVWPHMESASTALVLGIQEIKSSGLVSVPAFLQLLARELTHDDVTPSEAVKAAFYLSVSPDAIAGLAESLIKERNAEE